MNPDLSYSQAVQSHDPLRASQGLKSPVSCPIAPSSTVPPGHLLNQQYDSLMTFKSLLPHPDPHVLTPVQRAYDLFILCATVCGLSIPPHLSQAPTNYYYKEVEPVASRVALFRLTDSPLEINSATVNRPSVPSIRLVGSVQNNIPAKFLIDSGATALFMDSNLASRCGLKTTSCNRTVKLADSSIKSADGVAIARCRIQTSAPNSFLEFDAEFCVLDLSGYDVILGMPWLAHFKPYIDFEAGRVTVPHSDPSSMPLILSTVKEPVSEEQRESDSEIQSPTQLDCRAISSGRFSRLLKKNHFDSSSYEILLIRKVPPIPSQLRSVSTSGSGVDPITDQQGPALKALLQKYKHVLPAELPPGLPPSRSIEHTIKLNAEAKPHAPPLRRYSPVEDAEIRRQVQLLLERGHIRESVSPWGAMVLLAKKKDGALRFCVDYRILNNQTVKNRYALPLADDCFDQAQGARYFTKLDLHSGFWQIRLTPESAPLTAFRTRFGHYEFTVLPMGLCNAPATFMHLMNSLIHANGPGSDLSKFVLAFLDDIFIFSKTKEEHLQHIERVLQVLEKHKLYLKPAKCDWMKEEVEFLGHRIGRQGLSVDPHKIDAVKEWPVPKNGSEVRSFLGMTGYYRRFVENYTTIALPLTNLTKETVEWKWGELEQKAFETLKLRLTSTPVLLLADPTKPYIIHCDASGFAVGACLMQDQGQGLQPISYISCKMKDAETRYAPHEQELLALVYACKKWRHYIHSGPNKPFIVLSDHQSLRYFKTQPLLSARQARWFHLLSEFDFEIRYIEGVKNVVADALSRRADHAPRSAGDGQVRFLESAVKDTHSRQEFLAILDRAAERAIALKPEKVEDLLRMQAKRVRPDLTTPAAQAQRQRHVRWANEIVEPVPDLPKPDRNGARVMPSQHCTAGTKQRKPCQMKTKAGKYCYPHRRALKGTAVTKATNPAMGKGLIAKRDFEKGEVVAMYTGERRRVNQDSEGGAYYLSMKRGDPDHIDAARTNSGDGRWINSPAGTGQSTNCEFIWDENEGTMVARTTRRVAAGSEFFIGYGSGYWAATRAALRRARAAGDAAPQADPRGAKASRELVAIAELSSATLVRGDFKLVSYVRDAAQRDELYQKALLAPPADEQVRDGLLWLGERLVVPNDLKLRTDIMWELHDTPTGGHLGRDKTTSAVRQRFHWDGMHADVAKYVSTCDTCQRIKHSRQRMPGLLMSLPVPEEIDSHWTMDFLTGLPPTKDGHDAIQGHFSRGGSLYRLAATDTNVTAERAVDIFIGHVMRHHGVPESIVSDRGPQFIAQFWEIMWKRLGTRLDRSAAYHAPTDGKSERGLGKVTEVLRAFADEFPQDWDKLLPLVELALNSTPTAASGLSPYQLLYGRNPAQSIDRALGQLPPVDVNEEPSVGRAAAEQRWEVMEKAWNSVREKLREGQARMERYANKKRRALTFKVGDLVLLSTEHLKFRDPAYNRKLGHLFCGPFPIIEKINDNAYRLELPKETMKIHSVINISHLRKYKDSRTNFPHRPAPPGLSRPAPVVVDPAGDAYYVVERILAQKGKGKNATYLVKWLGWPYAESTWEPLVALDGAPDALQEFEELNKTLRR